MCYWVGTKKVREEMLRRLQQDPQDEIAQLFYKTFTAQAELPFREHYVAIGKSRPELSVLTLTPHKKLQFRNMYWGLPWEYTNRKTGKTYTREMINSTCEKVFFVHRDIIFSQRCVIPLDGYFEFFHFSGQVYPHFLHPAEGIFYIAGVWDEHTDVDTGEISQRFSLLSSPPNTLARKLHNNPKAPNGPRMLLILPQERIGDFLNPEASKEDLQKLFTPFPARKMEAYPTPRFLRKEFAPKINTEEVRKKVEYPELFFA